MNELIDENSSAETRTARPTCQPTLEDVAQAAGVSASTVSRVLNNKASVSEKVRLRIEDAVAHLGYKRRKDRSILTEGTIAILVPDILNPFFMEVARGAEDEAESCDQILFIMNITENPRQQNRLLRLLSAKEVEGIIICGWREITLELVEFYDRYNIPVVVIGRKTENDSVPCILPHYEKAVYGATQYLLQLHHKRIAYLSGPVFWETTKLKRSGFDKALDEFGLSMPPELEVSGFPNIESGMQLMSTLLQLPIRQRPTAVVAFNDLMALGALHAIGSIGLTVPEDMSVIGFDNIGLAMHSNPPLSTIAQPKYRMGRLAVKLIKQIGSGDMLQSKSVIYLDSSLIIRESTSVNSNHDEY